MNRTMMIAVVESSEKVSERGSLNISKELVI